MAESSHQSVQASTQAGNRESSSQSCGRIGTVGTLFLSDRSALSLLGRGQGPASLIPQLVPSALLHNVGSELLWLKEQPYLSDVPAQSLLLS